MKKMLKGVLVVGTAALLLAGCEGVGVGADYEALETEITGLREDYNALGQEFNTFRQQWDGFYQDWGTYREEIGLGGDGTAEGE